MRTAVLNLLLLLSAVQAVCIMATAQTAFADREVRGISSTWYAADGAGTDVKTAERAAALLKSYPFPEGYGLLGEAPKQTPALSAPADPYFNWADRNGENWLTPVRNQGGCGSCFVFGSVSVMESLFKIAVGDWNYNPDLSEQKAISCISLGSCSNGGTAEEVALHLKSYGVPDEKCFPYTSGNTGSDGDCADKCTDWQSRASKISNWSMSILPPSVADLKSQLQNGPIIANLQVYSDFFSYSSGVYSRKSTATAQGWHIVTLAGWDDSDNSWIIKNSWDTDWGTDGYGKLSRESDCILITQTGLCFASHTTTLTVDQAEAPSAPCTDPKTASVEVWAGETTHDLQISLKNCGRKGAFDWTGTVAPNATLSKTSGSLAAHAVQQITVTLKPSIMGVGNKTVTAKFKSGTMEALTTIEVNVLPDPPTDAGIQDAGQDAAVMKDAGFDGGVQTDSGAAADSGMNADSGTNNDSGAATDSGSASDSGTKLDSGSMTDSASQDSGAPDAGEIGDGGGQEEDSGNDPAQTTTGCSCSSVSM